MIIIPANTLSTGGYDVANSCRFDGSSAYMHKTPSSVGNRRTLTFSCWLKRSLPGDHTLFSANDATHQPHIKFDETNEELNVRISDSAGKNVKTSMVFRDFSAWYNIVVAIDTTQGTEANRVKIYVNGVQQTSLSTSNYPAQNYDTSFNTAIIHSVGRAEDSTNKYFNGYMAEVVYIDGLQLAADQFGEFDEDSAIWKPIDVSGLTFGTNGFYLDFEDSSNLGNDANGGTDLTEVNLAATDQSLDTCTNNFATINSLDNYYAQATFSNGNLTVVTPVSQYAYIRSTIAASSGKWYAELKITTASAADNQHGIVSDAAINSTGGVGERANAYGYRGSGQVVSGGSVVSYSAASYTAGDIISIAMDLDNNLIFFYKNGAIQNSGTGLAITAPASTTDGVYYFATSDNANLGGGTYQFDWNFGSPPFAISSGNTDGNGYGNFEYAVPSGYYALNTQNLAEYG